MSNKKIIILAVILSVLLIGGALYYSGQSSLSSPSPTSSGALEPGILVGNPSAKVTMEEYTSFSCSACGSFAAGALGRIKDDYIKTGKVKMVIYVLPPYEFGWAALCAQEQNKFVELHDYIFAHQSQITQESALKDAAVNAGLDNEKFNACYASGKYADKVTKWSDEAKARGVDATPTFFINGQKFIGAQPYDDFKKILDEKLNQAQ